MRVAARRILALVTAAAALAFSTGAAAAGSAPVWETVTGDIAFTCGGHVETWATWLAEYVGDTATGATRDFAAHTAGACPSGAGGTWETVTGDIAWPCGGAETWATWQAQVVGGTATGATRDWTRHASGTCAAAGPAPAALASFTLPFRPLALSPGPAPGDFVATDGLGECAVVLAGRLADTIPLCDWIVWTPGAPWVVHDNLSTPTIQGSHVVGYAALSLASGSTGTPEALPCAAGLPASVQPVAPGSVDYACGGRLQTLDLQAQTVTTQVYGPALLPAGRSPGQPFLLDPGGTLAAVSAPGGEVRILDLASGATEPGTYMAGAPQAEAWSAGGALALVNTAGGVTVWRPGTGAASAATPANPYGYRLLWAPDGRRVLVLETQAVGLSAPVAAGTWVSVSGSMTAFRPAIPAGDVVLALDPGGNDFWYGTDAGGGAAPSAYTAYEAALPA